MTLPRRVLSTGTIGILLVSLGVLAGAGPAIGDQTTATTLGYTCQFPSGAQQVQLQVGATFPETAATGAPITPADVSAKLDIPQVALGDLTTIGAASVTEKVDLSVVVRHNDDQQASIWPSLTAPNAPLPSTGDLTVDLTGIAPPVSEAGAGPVSFAADSFGLQLTPLTAAGTATTPATMPVACTLNPRQTANLATVVIPAAPGTATPSAPAQQQQQQTKSTKHSATPLDDLPVDPLCDDSVNGFPLPGDGTVLDAVLDGRTNLNKLGESTVADGIITLTNVGSWFGNDTTFRLCYTGQLDMRPSTTTILGFGFVPITATMQIVQANTPDNPMFVEASTTSDPTYPDGHPSGHSTALITIEVQSASVNGTPLNVGPHCRTRTPIPLEVANLPDLNPDNSEKYPYNGLVGGYMQGSITIPEFTGCGVEDNLDTLLSAPVTGPGNLTRICQGMAGPPDPTTPPPPPDEADDNCTAP
jgi:hypothetical protein